MRQRRGFVALSATVLLALFAGVAEAEAIPPATVEVNTVSAFGDAVAHGPQEPLSVDEPLVGISPTPTGHGYWLSAADGGVFSFGDARFYGSTGGNRLNQPVVGMAATRTGAGYWLVAADGGVFSFGDARFFGSTGALRLNQPIVGMVATRTGAGYWLVAADGGIFSFGDAEFHGSAGGLPLVEPMVAIATTPSGAGYWLAAADGGVFAFGDAAFLGSLADKPLRAPIRGVAAASDGSGYRLAGEDGEVYGFGTADHGSAALPTSGVAPQTIGIAGDPVGDGYWLLHGGGWRLQIEDQGPRVEALQRRLQALGYWVGEPDGSYGDLTRQAAYAFQKYEGLPVDGRMDSEDLRRLDAAERPTLGAAQGPVVEVDKSRQLLFFGRDGKLEWVFNASTGTELPYTYRGVAEVADTPSGTWTIDWQVDGWRESNLGLLYRPKYFHVDGIAIHGSTSVPPYPASHGCVRVSLEAADYIWAASLAPLGTVVRVYGTTPF